MIYNPLTFKRYCNIKPNYLSNNNNRNITSIINKNDKILYEEWFKKTSLSIDFYIFKSDIHTLLF